MPQLITKHNIQGLFGSLHSRGVCAHVLSACELEKKHGDVTTTGPCAAPGSVDWSQAKSSNSSLCFPAVQAPAARWKWPGHWSEISLMWCTVAKRAVHRERERERERALTHPPLKQHFPTSLFLYRPLLCAEKRAETNVTDKSGEDI